MNGPFAWGVDVGAAEGAVGAFTVGVAVDVALGVAVGVAVGCLVAVTATVALTVGVGVAVLLVQPAVAVRTRTQINSKGNAYLSVVLVYRFIILVIGFIIAY